MSVKQANNNPQKSLITGLALAVVVMVASYGISKHMIEKYPVSAPQQESEAK